MLEFSSKRLIYRILSVDDVTQCYVDWLNDPEVNRYLEIRHYQQTKESCREYVADMISNPSENLFGIYIRKTRRHIGNIKLGFVNKHHQRAQIALFIGDKTFWGKGLSTEAIKAITLWGFNELKLGKIEAGCYDNNKGSIRAFLKVGYQVEGHLRKNILFKGSRIDSFWLGVLPHEVT